MFTDSDFEVFAEPTLPGRMAQIRSELDPKFEQVAPALLAILAETGETWYAHVAQHRMRTTNPPENTWIAFSTNKRGYKMLPHFELGLWADRLYLYLAVESNMKPRQTATIMPKLVDLTPLVAQLPADFVLSGNHMEPEVQPLATYPELVTRFQKVKASEVLVGIDIHRGDPRVGTPSLNDTLQTTLKRLLPLYEQLTMK
ncbi:DUF1054 domain-containing protein [Fructilactobacillus myrtifloralis]|uniref:UPF0637 protein M3M35_03885 n=1 Tax=Fructilactobacillus myrtifloralis TaxID=2940301 RepID=A0ABY5BMM5_9LACO|nr:DUF1054 family protein [Fructilactobacillus myrtifloralis]USS84466.1 DUF1054 domain-containing protein [Fructilactobacillus myrtifloralis]